jgi:hypothetical protein
VTVSRQFKGRRRKYRKGKEQETHAHTHIHTHHEEEEESVTAEEEEEEEEEDENSHHHTNQQHVSSSSSSSTTSTTTSSTDHLPLAKKTHPPTHTHTHTPIETQSLMIELIFHRLNPRLLSADLGQAFLDFYHSHTHTQAHIHTHTLMILSFLRSCRAHAQVVGVDTSYGLVDMVAVPLSLHPLDLEPLSSLLLSPSPSTHTQTHTRAQSHKWRAWQRQMEEVREWGRGR